MTADRSYPEAFQTMLLGSKRPLTSRPINAALGRGWGGWRTASGGSARRRGSALLSPETYTLSIGMSQPIKPSIIAMPKKEHIMATNPISIPSRIVWVLEWRYWPRNGKKDMKVRYAKDGWFNVWRCRVSFSTDYHNEIVSQRELCDWAIQQSAPCNAQRVIYFNRGTQPSVGSLVRNRDMAYKTVYGVIKIWEAGNKMYQNYNDW